MLTMAQATKNRLKHQGFKRFLLLQTAHPFQTAGWFSAQPGRVDERGF
ncbi:hypothetical protein [Vandammella animalimorsus]|nr:hypothetical protein [Vandammella animalimorsus]